MIDTDERLMDDSRSASPYAAMVAITRLAGLLTPAALDALRNFQEPGFGEFVAAVQQLAADVGQAVISQDAACAMNDYHDPGEKSTCRNCLGDIVWIGRWVHVRQGECEQAQAIED